MAKNPLDSTVLLVEWDSLSGPAQEYIARLEAIAERSKGVVEWSRQDAMKSGVQKDNLYTLIREMATLLGV